MSKQNNKRRISPALPYVQLIVGMALGMVFLVGWTTATAGVHSLPKVRTEHHRRHRQSWVVVFQETFENLILPNPVWETDTYPDNGFSDDGAFFQNRGVIPPPAFRASAPFGKKNWLTVESYSRSPTTVLRDLFSITSDPAGGCNKVLRIASPAHTDATLVRSTRALPKRYRISLKVGYANFGNGLPGNNGYTGGELAEPWLADKAASEENGFYWLTILDTVPRPHNNVYLHHHRKVVLDSDNNVPPWMEIYNGQRFMESGETPLMMIGIDGKGTTNELNGKPFYSYAAGVWQPSGKIRAVDAYKSMTWYRASIERNGDRFTLKVTGNFKFGGRKTYKTTINAADKCVWHYNRKPLAADSPCIDNSHYPSLPNEPALWSANIAWPDFFMFGEPHNNFYEGEVFYDDIRLEIWRG
ncbi:MAG: hypothetical protein HY308_17580 [Gammaproteobacteria bacterium]|nr:hypothetical protein [Gammaproteobacteria bacterium]